MNARGRPYLSVRLRPEIAAEVSAESRRTGRKPTALFRMAWRLERAEIRRLPEVRR